MMGKVQQMNGCFWLDEIWIYTMVTVCWIYPLKPNSASFGNRLLVLKRRLYTGSTELHSSCVLMRWILMTPSPVHWRLIPIQGGLVFKFIIKSRVISGLTHTVCYGKVFAIPNGQFLFICLDFIMYSIAYPTALWTYFHFSYEITAMYIMLLLFGGWAQRGGGNQCLAVVCAT